MSEIDELVTIYDGLELLNVSELRNLLNKLDDPRPVQRKDELVAAAADYLSGDALKALWERLTPVQRAAVSEAVHGDGCFYATPFQAKYGSLPGFIAGIREGYFTAKNASFIDLFFFNLRYPRTPKEQLPTVPSQLRAELKAWVPKPQPLRLKTLPEAPATWEVVHSYYDYSEGATEKTRRETVDVCYQERETAALAEFQAVLRAIELGKIKVSDKTSMPTKASLKAIAPLLIPGDYYDDFDFGDVDIDHRYTDKIEPIRPFAWVVIVQAGKLAEKRGTALELTAAGRKALGGDPASSLKTAWTRWLKSDLLDEFRRVRHVKGQNGKGKRYFTPPAERRGRIVEVLGDVPVGEWVTLKQFARYANASERSFQVTQNSRCLYLCEAYYGMLYGYDNGWGLFEDTYLRCFFMEFAATMGAIDIGYISPYHADRRAWQDLWGSEEMNWFSQYDGVQLARLTPLGAYFLDRTTDYEAPDLGSQETLRVLPNLDVVATGSPLSPAERLLLDAYADSTGDAVWRLDRDRILAAIESGQSLDRLRDFLQRTCTGAIPDTVQQFFDDLQDRSTSVRLQGTVLYLDCKDAALAVQIANDRRTKKYCHLAGDRHLVVPLDLETRFRTALRKLGYTLPPSELP